MSTIHSIIALNSIREFNDFLKNSNNINIEELDESGNMTPLMHAAHIGNLEILNALIKKGADVRARICWRTALAFAANKNYADCVKELLKYEEGHVNDIWSAVDAAYAVAPENSESIRILEECINANPSRLQLFFRSPIQYMFGANNANQSTEETGRNITKLKL